MRTRKPFWPHGGPDLHKCGLTSGQSLSSTPMGRHRLAGQRAWPMDPAKKGGNKEPQASKAEGSFLDGGPQVLPNSHTSLLPQSFSHAKTTCQDCAGAVGSQKARETPQNGCEVLGDFHYSVVLIRFWGRAGQGSKGGGCRRWQQREVAILLLRLPEYPSSPHPTGWAILACRLWCAMRWARCLKLLSHAPQRKGRSPVCTRRWSSR